MLEKMAMKFGYKLIKIEKNITIIDELLFDKLQVKY
jgi:hypothetical protein